MGQDSSKTPIENAKKYLDAKGISYKEYTGTNVTEVQQAVATIIKDGADAVFTPTDNTIMTAELSIYEDLAKAGIPHYTGAIHSHSTVRSSVTALIMRHSVSRQQI